MGEPPRSRPPSSPAVGELEEDARLVQAPWERQLDAILLRPGVVSLRLLRSDRPLTLRACVPPFLRWLVTVRGRSRITAVYYAASLRQLIEYCDTFGVEAPGAITEANIETFLAALTARGCQARTVVRHFYAFRSFFQYLMREQVIARDPAATAFGPKVKPRLPAYLTVPEITRVLRRLSIDRTPLGQRDWAIVATFLYTGLRSAELATLRLERVRLAEGWLRVLGKGQRERDVPIPRSLAPILQHYLTTVRPQLVDSSNPYVFVVAERGWAGRSGNLLRPKYRARPLQTRTIHRAVVSRVSRILGRRVHPHMLRHSYATRLRNAGGDLQLIQELLGHAELGTTMIYSHLATEGRQNEVDRLVGKARGGHGVTVEERAAGGGRRRRTDAVLGPHAAVGDRLRAARHRAGLTIDQLATKAPVGRSTLNRAERGIALPRTTTLVRLAEMLGIEVGALLHDDTSAAEPEEG